LQLHDTTGSNLRGGKAHLRQCELELDPGQAGGIGIGRKRGLGKARIGLAIGAQDEGFTLGRFRLENGALDPVDRGGSGEAAFDEAGEEGVYPEAELLRTTGVTKQVGFLAGAFFARLAGRADLAALAAIARVGARVDGIAPTNDLAGRADGARAVAQEAGFIEPTWSVARIAVARIAHQVEADIAAILQSQRAGGWLRAGTRRSPKHPGDYSADHPL
jgi:hypothetical protein